LARTAADLMSAPAVTVLTGRSIVATARLMDSEKVKRLPVVDDLGRLVGIVTRSDLLKVHLRPDDDIRADVEAGALASLADVKAQVSDGVVTLDGQVAQASTAEEAGRLARLVPGVVDVVNQIRFDYDDRAILATGLAYGVA
jgi:CBS-domain-containing membrane protein